MARKVIHVLGTAQQEGASIAGIVASLGRGLDPAKYALQAWFIDGDGPLRKKVEDAGVRTRFIPWGLGIRDVRGMAKFWHALRHEDSALVHQHYGDRSIRLVVRWASQARLICHVHGTVDEHPPGEPIRIRRPYCDRVVATSRAVARQISGVDATVIYPGVAQTAQRDERAHAGEIVIGAASRMVRSKGLDILLRAFSMVQRESSSVRLELAGEGPERGALEALVRDLGIGNVAFLGWCPEMAPVHARWDIFVQPSLQESLGVANLEAMQSGLPVVASRIGGIPEAVIDGETGILVPPGDAAALAEGVRRLTLDAELRRRLGHRGREWARALFSDALLVSGFERLYDEMLA